MSCLTEYNEEETMQMFKEEGREEGRAEGQMEIMLSCVRDGVLPAEIAAEKIGMDVLEFTKLL